MKTNIAEIIETLIDKSSVLDVLTAIECVCGEKADHIRANWQDVTTAKAWDATAKIVGKAAREAQSLTT